jgi:hypothetical protein
MNEGANQDMQNRNIDELMERYLLGELSEEESERMERQYLSDPDYFDELLAVEDDLLDEYARGELQGRRRQQFERRLLTTPRQRERLRDAQVLMARLGSGQVLVSLDRKRQERSSRSSFFSQHKLGVALPLALAAIVLLAGAGWLVARTARLQEQVERMRAEQSATEGREQELRERLAGEQKEKEDLLRQLQQANEAGGSHVPKGEIPPEKRIEPNTVTFALAVALMRGGEASTFVLPSDIEIVQLEIQVADAPYRSYRADVQTADGETVYRQSGLVARRTQRGKAIRLRIPSRLLHGRDFILKASGLAAQGDFEDAGLYSFRILRK